MKLLFWIFVVGIFLLLSSSTNAENNQTGNSEGQHYVTGKLYVIEERNCTISLSTYIPSTNFS